MVGKGKLFHADKRASALKNARFTAFFHIEQQHARIDIVGVYQKLPVMVARGGVFHARHIQIVQAGNILIEHNIRVEIQHLIGQIRKIGKLVDIYDATPRTQCVALDVALSSKVLACQSQQITLTCLADGRSLGFMEDSDVYALFGNILDNAIEAASKISDPDKRQISLTVSNREGFLLIEAENFFSGEVTFEQGLPVTTKEDRGFHGFGTRSIQILTEKYGGDLSMTVEDGIFRLSIMLPIAAAA